ncbi:hypothetical protein [Bifidobacterium saguinibicoloris]|uniref:hypothetical protein n=1 Tax=Bifidobacterium saguinibicoloris TaxID=2834433 RepID=UPI001C5947C8|nr:hypothetical protein [Bifidobacterium saguinibicoloris]MBW3081734.1 hypothetical protein [Bifidobacterium saguinibicoloris]
MVNGNNQHDPQQPDYAKRLHHTLIALPVVIVIGVIATIVCVLVYGGVKGLTFAVTIDLAMLFAWLVFFLTVRKYAREQRDAMERAARQARRTRATDAPRPAAQPAVAQPATRPTAQPVAPQAHTQPAAPQDVHITVRTMRTDATQPGDTTPAAPPQRSINARFAVQTGVLQRNMAMHALSLISADAIASGRVTTAYVHAFVQDGQSHWDCFFHAGNGLVGAGDLLKNQPDEDRRAFFAHGRELMDDYRAACAAYHVDKPTELRITADAKTHEIHTDVGYQPFDGTNGTPGTDPFTAWASEIYRHLTR